MSRSVSVFSILLHLYNLCICRCQIIIIIFSILPYYSLALYFHIIFRISSSIYTHTCTNTRTTRILLRIALNLKMYWKKKIATYSLFSLPVEEHSIFPHWLDSLFFLIRDFIFLLTSDLLHFHQESLLQKWPSSETRNSCIICGALFKMKMQGSLFKN